MATFILITLFTIVAWLEGTAYAIYEIKINKNKLAGIVLIVVSLIGLVFPISMYLKF